MGGDLLLPVDRDPVTDGPRFVEDCNIGFEEASKDPNE